MKKTSSSGFLIIIALISGISSELLAQQDTVNNPDQFVLPEFSVGVAKLKDGKKVVLDLNYNIVTEKMVFKQNSQIYNIVNESAIDTVFIEGRKFVPFDKVFYEVVVKGPVSFFIQHKGAVKRPPRPAAYGGSSQVSSSTYISNLKLGNDVYRNDHKGEIIIEPGSLYWIRKSNEYFAVTGKAGLLKIFEDRKKEVKEFTGKPKFDPENPEHIKELVIYYNGLKQ